MLYRTLRTLISGLQSQRDLAAENLVGPGTAVDHHRRRLAKPVLLTDCRAAPIIDPRSEKAIAAPRTGTGRLFVELPQVAASGPASMWR
jgi:hypothetical protein